jgi:superfamily II DNA or RNA helicase
MGLGAHADGVFHELVLGPDTRDLMDMGYLTEYRIVSCPTFLNLDDKKDISSSTGDYKKPALVAATEESSIVGDVVSHYLKFAKGKLGITFVPSIKIAEEIAEQFRNAGVPAMALSSKNTNMERHRALRDFRNKKLMQLINVDLFGEGFDLPAIECISIARKTQSLSLHLQMLGRVLRIMEGKGKALIIDHVGNCLNPHLGLPDKRRTWSLDRRERRSNKASDEKPLKVCVNPECMSPYERHNTQCPYCGFRPESMPRNDPDFVDGSLVLFDDELLDQLRGDIQKVDKTCEEYRVELINKKTPMKYQMIQIKRHDNLQKCIKLLRESMAWWAGYHRAMNRCDEEIQKRFYLKFKVDMLTAQTLNVKSAQELTFKINTDLTELVKEYNNVQSISMG